MPANVAGIEHMMRQVQLVEYVYVQESAGKDKDGPKDKKGKGISVDGFVDEFAVVLTDQTHMMFFS